MNKWITLAVAAVVIFFLWNKFGGKIKSALPGA